MSSGWNKGVKSQIRSGLGRSRVLGSLGTDSPSQSDASPPAGQPASEHASPLDLDRGTMGDEAENPVVIPDDDPSEPGQAGGEATSSDEEGEIRSAFSGDDEAVMINLAEAAEQAAQPSADAQSGNSDIESGEITEEELPSNLHLHGSASSQGDEEEEEEEEEEGEISDDDDAAMSDDYDPPTPEDIYDGPASPSSIAPDVPITAVHVPGESANTLAPLTIYTSARLVHRLLPGPPPTTSNPSTTPSLPTASVPAFPPGTFLTLGDLSMPDLEYQLRYYHIGRPASSIPLSTPVRCPSCAGSGHLSATCPARACDSCGLSLSHASAGCSSGPHAAAPGPLAPGQACALCECAGHATLQCERWWRTSAWPPAESVDPTALQLFCYECGDPGHLGNDCSMRPPRKGLGSSTWSAGAVVGSQVLPCWTEDDDLLAGDDLLMQAPLPLPLPGKGGRNKRIKMGEETEEQQADDGGLVLHARDSKQTTLMKSLRGEMAIDRGIGSGRLDLKDAPPGAAPPAQQQGGALQDGQGTKNSNKRPKKSYNPRAGGGAGRGGPRGGARGGGGRGGQSYRGRGRK